MEQIEKKDLRFTRTEELIQKTFREMLQEMDYAQITIKELTQRAGINRKTFYLHYLSLDFLLGKLQSDLLIRFFQPVAGTVFPKDLKKVIWNLFEFSTNADALAEKILCSKGTFPPGEDPWESTRQKLCGDHDCFPGVTGPEKNMVLAYLTGSICEIYKQCVADGRRIPMEDAVNFSARLLSRGLLDSGVISEEPEWSN